MNERIVNLTPHDIVVLKEDDSIKSVFKSDGLARLESRTVYSHSICGIPITVTVFGAVEGLPERVDHTYYIVSQLIKSAYSQRDDLLVPAQVVRDDKGVIIGCRSLGL